MDGSSAMCSLSMSACPIHQSMGVDPDIAHSRTYQNPYNHSPQSLDYPTCAESLHMPRGNADQNFYTKAHENQFDDNQHELMMKKLLQL